ncbi:MAG: prepilin peptidase [Hyphomonadaceae bacterium]|nr:prepilin peptidase [Hyphomonadaceae bacterium]
MIAILALAAFAGLLIYAACSDVASLTIPNWISIALVALFPVAALAAGLSFADIGMHLLFGFGVLVVGFFLFQAGVFGGGDAKLLAAASIWSGFTAFWPLISWMVFAGGFMALAILAARQFVPQAETNPPFVNRLLTGKTGIPYGLAIMIGGLAAIPSMALLPSPLTLP